MKSPSSTNGDSKTDFSTLPSLDELTVACREKILNPDFLLHGDGVPFSEPSDEKNGKEKNESDIVNSPQSMDEKVLSPRSLPNSPIVPSPSTSHEDIKNDASKVINDHDNDKNNNSDKSDEFDLHAPKTPVIVLKSRKMKGLKDLLLAEKLNTNAISLQITAQSHIGHKKSRSSMGGDEMSSDNSRPKRSRRE